MQELSISITASTVAWYGAVVATFALVINGAGFVHKLMQDRFNVSLLISPNMQVFPHGLYPHPQDTPFVNYTIINKGIRPVVITSAGFRMRKGAGNFSDGMVLCAAEGSGKLPQEIKGGDRYHVLALQNEIVKHLDGIDFFYVQSAIGSEFRKKLDRKLLASFCQKSRNKEPKGKD